MKYYKIVKLQHVKGKLMNWAGGLKAGLILILMAGICLSVRADINDMIGITLLRAVTTNLNGAGVRVAQPEADSPASGDFEVNPGGNQVGLTVGLITYISSTGSSSSYPNSVGAESVHADDVAKYFYGTIFGVATNVLHVDNYEASDFVTGANILGNFIVTLPSTNIGDSVVNQSFNLTVSTTNNQESFDTAYDNYAAKYNTLFVTGVGNGGAVNPPATCYNGLGVGAYGGSSSTGPTPDNGRAKPDLVAPAGETSFSTPQVSGAAAILIQAGLRGDGGSDTNSAVAMATLKALLLNGAIKPPDWTNASPSPLDARYGAGVLNVFNSYKQLTGGKHGYNVAGLVAAGGAHPPTGASATVSGLSGWDYNTNTSSSASDGVNHYYFNVTNAAGAATFAATATLVWNRHQNQTAINNLNLFLYNTANNNLVASSVSTVDNMEHVWVPHLPAGRYDLQVWKAGGAGIVSTTEPYALAYEYAAPGLSVTHTAGSTVVMWPVYPAGFLLESTTNLLLASAWNTNYPAPAVSNGQNQLVLATTNTALFFRLILP